MSADIAPFTELAGGALDAFATAPLAGSIDALFALLAYDIGAWIGHTRAIDTRLCVCTLYATTWVIDTESISTLCIKGTADRRTGWDTLSSSTEISRLTGHVGAWVGDTLHPIADRALFATGIGAGVGDTLPFPTSIIGVGAFDAFAGVVAHKAVGVTELP